MRQDDYEQLKRKIGLQQELIRRQDTLIEQKRAQQQQEIQQVLNLTILYLCKGFLGKYL